jgi:hypothetical protein
VGGEHAPDRRLAPVHHGRRRRLDDMHIRELGNWSEAGGRRLV